MSEHQDRRKEVVEEWWKRPQQREKASWVDVLQAVWPLLMGALLLASSWGAMSIGESQLRASVNEMKETVSGLGLKMDTHETRLTRTEEQVSGLKDSINILNMDLKEFLKEMRGWKKKPYVD